MFAVDDELECSPKHEALDELPAPRRARAFEAWLRLGAACRKRGNGGVVTLALAAKILHAWKPAERTEAIADLVEAKGGRQHGLLVPDGASWRFHEWAIWQPDEDEAAEERETVSKKTLRQRRWRHRKRHGVDDEASTQASTVDASDEHDETPTQASTETPTERLRDVSRAQRAPATRARVPDPVPIPTLPVQDLPADHREDPTASVSDLAPDPEVAHLRRAFESRWLAKRTSNGMALGTTWAGFGKHYALAAEIAHRYAGRHDELARSLDGFFASAEPFVVNTRWAFKTWANNPDRFVGTRVEPSANAIARMADVPRMETR